MADGNVVGRGKGKQQTGSSVVNTPLPATTDTPDFVKNISSRLQAKNIPVPEAPIAESGNWIENLTGNSAEAQTLAKIFKSMRKNVADVSSLKALIAESKASGAKSFAEAVSILQDEIIPGMAAGGTGGPSTTQTITQYSDDQLKTAANSYAQSVAGKNLSQEEIDIILPKLKKLVEEGTTTTTKKVGGKNVVTVKQGYTAEGAKTLVEQEIAKINPQDIAVQKNIEFADFLSKNMAGM